MGELDTEFLGDERRCDADRLGIDAIQRADEDALHKATGLARWNSRYAVDIAQKLSDQLCG